ncbi:hypothetical protein [Micromonospora arida]
MDRRLRDPYGVTPPSGDIFPPPIKGHRPCESEKAFTDAVRQLADHLR